ncbi:hypothetical protein Ahy_A03g011155 [Arachis hypogaea]|uniref:PB1-like domain-containing protein n=1 Tax=Arachis hypogaea TaxID=3818 RepID=A0A445DPS2_ARAHY|nr:hypothetical protein Ahy_A03g011155 [Arachis hypogaea]
MEECWLHVPRRSLDSSLRVLNSDDELREMCFMAEKNDGLVDVYFEHAVSSLEILEGKEIIIYVDDDHDELRMVGDELGNEPLSNKILNQANKPTASADKTPLSNNYELTNLSANKPTAFVDNTSPPDNTKPANPGTNNPISHNNEPIITSNSNPNQATTVKPISKTLPIIPKTKPKDEDLDNALDPGTESDEANSWYSEEMKIPPFRRRIFRRRA